MMKGGGWQTEACLGSVAPQIGCAKRVITVGGAGAQRSKTPASGRGLCSAAASDCSSRVSKSMMWLASDRMVGSVAV